MAFSVVELSNTNKLGIFRYAKVFFGIKSSPLLLASVIEYKIKNDEEYNTELKQKLLRSIYADNVVTSVNKQEDFKNYIICSKNVMSKGTFDLREWKHIEERKDTEHVKETVAFGLY